MSAEIAQGEKLQTEFISSVSHELRTPLTAITGWSETLSYDSAIQGDSRRGVLIISKEASRLTKMVEELLEFTRIQGGRFNLNVEKMDVSAELEDAIFTYGSLLRQEGVELVYEAPEQPLPLIEGDPERLKQVFLNILDNAAKYGRGGEKIIVSVSRAERFVRIQVRDFGPGIPAEELPHVKEKFYKGSSKERGSGIGLAVCDEIVTRHGGTLSIENAQGGGVLVTVSLPAE
jgi:signal transduction histidine kinase